jgi:citrate lyase subunit alpha/citrate CoA-transferase
MKKCDNFVINAAGRKVPTLVNGQEMVAYKGLRQHRPTGRKYASSIPTCIDYPDDGNKLLPSLADALKKCGLIGRAHV